MPPPPAVESLGSASSRVPAHPPSSTGGYNNIHVVQRDLAQVERQVTLFDMPRSGFRFPSRAPQRLGRSLVDRGWVG
jgi:hypothetical protein